MIGLRPKSEFSELRCKSQLSTLAHVIAAELNDGVAAPQRVCFGRVLESQLRLLGEFGEPDREADVGTGCRRADQNSSPNIRNRAPVRVGSPVDSAPWISSRTFVFHDAVPLNR